jgi:hypothetical protein
MKDLSPEEQNRIEAEFINSLPKSSRYKSAIFGIFGPSVLIAFPYAIGRVISVLDNHDALRSAHGHTIATRIVTAAFIQAAAEGFLLYAIFFREMTVSRIVACSIGVIGLLWALVIIPIRAEFSGAQIVTLYWIALVLISTIHILYGVFGRNEA